MRIESHPILDAVIRWGIIISLGAIAIPIASNWLNPGHGDSQIMRVMTRVGESFAAAIVEVEAKGEYKINDHWTGDSLAPPPDGVVHLNREFTWIPIQDDAAIRITLVTMRIAIDTTSQRFDVAITPSIDNPEVREFLGRCRRHAMLSPDIRTVTIITKANDSRRAE